MLKIYPIIYILTSAKEHIVIIVVCLSVCLLATLRKNFRIWICMKFSGKVGNGPVNKRLNFGNDPDHGFRSVWRYWVRRALAEVCTVPVSQAAQ